MPIKVYKTVRARELFDKIVTQAHHNGEPGVLFLDAANRSNPVPHLYQLEATNPCGEQWLGPYENCCLGSVNLAQHFGPGWHGGLGEAAPERGALHRSSWMTWWRPMPTCRRCRSSGSRPPRPAHRPGDHGSGRPDVPRGHALRLRRRPGIRRPGDGVCALPFHADQHRAGRASAAPSRPSRAAFMTRRTCTGSRRSRCCPTPAIGAARRWIGSRSWTGIRQHGIRNAAQTTIAPTGTIATVAGCEGYGCEPVFALAYIRHVNDNGKDLQLTYTSPLFEHALEQAGIDRRSAARRSSSM